MSRIFDALRNAQHTRQSGEPQTGTAPPKAERRRSPRWSARVPVVVCRQRPESEAASQEEAYTANISEIGGLLVMATFVHAGETLYLANKATRQQQECRVAHVSENTPGNIEVAVEFSQLAPDFWRLTPWYLSPEQAAASK